MKMGALAISEALIPKITILNTSVFIILSTSKLHAPKEVFNHRDTKVD